MFDIFKKFPELICCLSKKDDGAMKFLGKKAIDKNIEENRRKFLAKFSIEINQVIGAGLVHGSNIRIVTEKDKGRKIEKTDGLAADRENIFLTMTVADCLPIFLFNQEKKAIVLIHAGWRGLAENILISCVKKMEDDFKLNPGNLLAGIGPGISACHFEVKEDALKKFKASAAIKRKGKIFLDLKKIAKNQLITAGLKNKNIEVSEECTFCLKDKYFSFRRDFSPGQPLDERAMMAVIGIKGN